jgi:taurine transport system substrate-binding protein
MKKYFREGLLVIATLALTAAPHAWAQKKVIVGNFGDPAPYEAAAADGRFKQATGWDIEWRKFNSGAEVNAAMASGAIMISELGSVPLAAGASQGVDYQLFLISKAIGASESLIVRNGAGVDKPADLKGKKIAVPVGSTAHFSLMGGLKMWGLSDKDVQVIGMSPPEIAAAWSQNAIDAAFIWEPVQSKLMANGKRMTTAADVGKAGYPTFNGWVVNTKFAQENRAGLIGFIKVINEIDEDYANNKSKWTADSAAVKSIAGRLGAAPAEIVADLDGAKYLSGTEQVSADWLGGGAAKSMKSTADFLKSVGRINASSDNYSKYVNAEYAKAAVAK